MNPLDIEEVKKVCEEKGPVDITPDADGMLKFEEYLKIFSIIVLCQIRFAKRIEDENKDNRRALLQTGNRQQFAMVTTK